MNTCPQVDYQFANGHGTLILSGSWTALSLAGQPPIWPSRTHHPLQECGWDLSKVTNFDHIGALTVLNQLNNQRPATLMCSPTQHALLERALNAQNSAPEIKTARLTLWINGLARPTLGALNHFISGISLFGQLILDIGKWLRHPLQGPWKELSAHIYTAGFCALGITALVGALIGIVLAYLSAQQLNSFGANTLIVNILGMSIFRELGPLLAAILVAGRSGAAITAQIGVMRVTEELDAMQVLGLPIGFRLVLPRVLALVIAMPLLVLWTDAMALLGGALISWKNLNIDIYYFLQALPRVIPIANVWLGLIKGTCFGLQIGLVSCYFGLRIEPNTQSLGQGTTTSVVVAITSVIIIDALFAIIFRNIGLV
jgi:phospholipid/cholesterol/gamma-HCH transport system permease protein